MSIVVNARGSLERYIETGLKNNLVLQEKNISLESALNALKTANRNYVIRNAIEF